MKTNRRILFAKCILVGALSIGVASVTKASTTKVGNGDDGADLESLTEIKSGPIWSARLRAVELLQNLNVTGISGMGLLIPELKNTQMLMAEKDVHPTVEQPGTAEISDDKVAVYARTFAEPYAATRFFPAATGLTSDQLVALHIHEALHRSLPAEIRGDENKVMHLTLALTSPGASFDRVTSVANLYIKAPQFIVVPNDAAGTSSAPLEAFIAPEKTSTKFAYGIDAYSDGRVPALGSPIHGIEFGKSLGGYRKVAGYVVEPYFRARLKVLARPEMEALAGTSSFEIQGKMQLDEQVVAGPFLRFTAKAFDEGAAVEPMSDRDIFTIGGFYRIEQANTYLDTSASYSLPSSAMDKGDYWPGGYGGSGYRPSEVKFSSILSATARAGFRLHRFLVGAIGEFHSSGGYEVQREDETTDHLNAFRLLVVGPEFGYVSRGFEMKAYYKTVLNSTTASLSQLGDVMDRGAGGNMIGTSIAMKF